MSGPVDIFLIYSFLKRLTTPFEQTKAFQLGLIDAEGNRLKKAETSQEKSAMGYFDRLVFNLKRLLAKVPGGSSPIASFAAALLLLREDEEIQRLATNVDYLYESLMFELDNVDPQDYHKVKELLEDMGAPANATGAPGVVGTGDDPVSWKKPLGLVRRGRPKTYNLWKPVKRGG